MIDWTARLETREGRPGTLLEADGWQRAVGDTRRRVQVCNFLRPRTEAEQKSYTTYLAYEDGGVRGDKRPSDFDILNAA